MVGQSTPLSTLAVPDGYACHVPDVRASVIPAAPTATHDELLAQLTALRNWVVPELSADQVLPPLTVERTFPSVPTTMQFVAEAQLTLVSVSSAPDSGFALYVQVAPASAVE